jgi:hypothetical protein
MKQWIKVALWATGTTIVVDSIALVAPTRPLGSYIVRHPPESREPILQTPADCGFPYEDVTVTTADGLRLVGWCVPPDNGVVIIA